MKRFLRLAAGSVVLFVAAAATVWYLNVRGEDNTTSAQPAGPASAEQIERGAYLARAGNCLACHTTRGGTPYAGGRAIETPFGTVFGSNLTPDNTTGIGTWTSADFWRALHHGRSKDGRLLYPAFPYTSFTQVSRPDSDALYAYLRSLPATAQANREHQLRFPYQSQAALAVWRALYFTPGSFAPEAGRSAEWNRGAYLVKGLGHCAACHTARNALGASDNRLDLAGGLIPMQNWYAPSLTDAHEAGVAHWALPQIVQLLKTGSTPQGSVAGPMAEVVLHSTQHLSDADLTAMAGFLQALPQSPAPTPAAPPLVSARQAALGAKVYEQHCVACHGEKGNGVAGAYPPLAGNRAVTMASTANLVQMVLNGGFAPATAGNPRPFGMPPYRLLLNDGEVAAVLTHLRSQWGNQASPVSELEVGRFRSNAR